MLISQWDPFREFDRAVTRSRVATIPMDAVRTEREVIARFDVPGASLEDLDVTVERNLLTVSMTRREVSDEGATPIAREIRVGDSRREVVLADTLDGSNVSAELDRGVLTVRIPVAERSLPQKVLIGSASPVSTEIGDGSDPGAGEA